MERFVIQGGRYEIDALDRVSAQKIIDREMKDLKEIQEKVYQLLKLNGEPYQNLVENTRVNRIKIRLYDGNSLIYGEEQYKGKNAVARKEQIDGDEIKYGLGLKYEGDSKKNINYDRACEVIRLAMSPHNQRQLNYDRETKTTEISGVIVKDAVSKNVYGTQINESLIKVLAQITMKNGKSLDSVLKMPSAYVQNDGERKADNLIKLLIIATRNDYEREITFEKLINLRLDSTFRNKNEKKIPQNEFIYAALNDSSKIEKDFDKYMGKGSYKQFDKQFEEMLLEGKNSEKRQIEYENIQNIILQYADKRMQINYQKAKQIDENAPGLEIKKQDIEEAYTLLNGKTITNKRQNIVQAMYKKMLGMSISSKVKNEKKQMDVDVIGVSKKVESKENKKEQFKSKVVEQGKNVVKYININSENTNNKDFER